MRWRCVIKSAAASKRGSLSSMWSFNGTSIAVDSGSTTASTESGDSRCKLVQEHLFSEQALSSWSYSQPLKQTCKGILTRATSSVSLMRPASRRRRMTESIGHHLVNPLSFRKSGRVSNSSKLALSFVKRLALSTVRTRRKPFSQKT